MHVVAATLAAVALAGGGNDAKTQQHLSRLGDLVVNVRSADYLARTLFGGDAWRTVQLDESLVRLEKTKLALSKAVRRGTPTASLQRQLQSRVSLVVKQGTAIRKGLSPADAGNAAMATDVLKSLGVNLSLLRQTTKSILQSLAR